jgi:tetratricopeptide (TPR) repeat protein
MSKPDSIGSPPRSKVRRNMMLVLAGLAVLAGAGIAFRYGIGTTGVQGQAVPGQASDHSRPAAETDGLDTPGRPIAVDEPAFWSDVAVFKAGPGRPRPIVVVKRGEQPKEGEIPGLYQGLLAREVVRQALMLAAREEFGAITRDVPIGDPGVTGTPDSAFRVGSRFRVFLGSNAADPPIGRITLDAGTGGGRRVLLSREFDCGMLLGPDYARLVSQVEVLSRGVFRETLEGLGLKRAEVAPGGDGGGGLPEGVEDRLGRPVEPEQFAAIRALHDAIRTRGETPARLQALARAYANLGTLSEAQWTADYLAFEARALLYAQRALVRDPKSPASLRARAYVEAVAGLFAPALDDLDAADKIDGGKGAPAWSGMIRAYCRSDTPALDAMIKDRPDDPWPLYFRFLSRLHASGIAYENLEHKVCRGEIIPAGRALLERVPDCYRVYDGMVDAAGVGNLHEATSVGLELYPEAIRRRIESLPGLPAGIVREASDEVGLRRRLDAAAADDPSDVTWGVLARALRETRFLLVCQRLYFLSLSLAVDPGPFAAESLPLLADHPHRAYLTIFTGSVGARQAIELFRSFDLADIERKQEIFLLPLRRLDPQLDEAYVRLIWDHMNLGTVQGQITRLVTVSAQFWSNAHNLHRYDPDSPLARGCLIEAKWQEASPHVAAWETDHGGDAFVLAQLGFRRLSEKNLAEAERLFKQALARSPDGWIFKGLAEVYRQESKVDQWIKDTEEYLKTEDMALDHAHALEDLAKYLMEAKRYEQARPFAERAAQSGAGWAMISAARCAEEVKDWEAAERWVSASTRRYSKSWLDWIYWCKRTGRGDAKAAAGVVRAQLAAGRTPSTDEEAVKVAIVLILDGRPKEAKDLLENLVRAPHDTATQSLLILACDRHGDTAARDSVMRAVADDPKASGPKSAQVIGILAEWLKTGEGSPLDVGAIDAVLGDKRQTANSCVFIGDLLDRHGKADAARAYLDAANTPDCYPWFRLLAMDSLRARGVDPGSFPW